MKKLAYCVIFSAFMVLGCRGETVLVKIDGDPVLTDRDIPSHVMFLPEDSFFSFIDSVTDIELILITAREESFEQRISLDIEDLRRIIIIDSFLSSISDSLVSEHKEFAERFWEESQIQVRAMLVRIPPGRLDEARQISDSMKTLIGDTTALKEYVISLRSRYNFGGLYFGPSGDLRDIFPFMISFSLGEILLTLPEYSISQPIETDTGIFVLARLETTEPAYPGDFEDLKELIVIQENQRFYYEQTSRMIDGLRKRTNIKFNDDVFGRFSALPPFQRLTEEDQTVLPNIEEELRLQWLAVVGGDTILVADLIERLKTNRILYPNLSDTSMLRLFLTRDIVPPYLLLQEAGRRGISLEGELLAKFSELKDSLVFRSYIYSRTGAEVDSQEVYAYYLSNGHLFSLPERVELYIIGVTDSLFAEELLDSVTRGAPFESLAERYSLLPSAKNSGDLGFVARGRYRSEIDSLIFSLEPESFSDAVFMDGYWVIFKTGSRKSDSLLPLPDVWEVCKALCEEEIRRQITGMILENARKKHLVQIDSSAVRNVLSRKKEEL
ncbi:peptidylprolyl isomerase [candidate division WOR-3 bacterium]|nr:peptidylprolyl isomerase [candidate division WOR-3 bacterium]